MSITLGSLFDGIGGFPLAALRLGITPIWASEIEPFPLRVTALRFPEMAQLGDITRLNGADVPPVDIVTGGSPCQDLSIAGARAGLAGERSGLFLEQIRLIREMREVDQHRQRPTEFIRPRFMVWENVPGTFSSAEGEDFRIVLEETVRIAAPACSVPRPPNGKWHPAGALWETDSLWLGAPWTRNTGACPSAERASSLWQILEGRPPPKYFLSQRACRGILLRAEKRGKPLPSKLEWALQVQAGLIQLSTSIREMKVLTCMAFPARLWQRQICRCRLLWRPLRRGQARERAASVIPKKFPLR